jgi:alkylresorcinol/alkylpyrone synthase
MFITGLGTAAPPRRYTQAESWEALRASKPFAGLKPRSQEILRKVLTSRNGIASRHLAPEPLSEVFDQHPDTLYQHFIRHAPSLATQASERALRDTGRWPEEIDAIIVSTCTGYLCPGLTSYVVERLGLRPDVLALDLVGQGCGAALPNLRTGEALIASGRCRRVLSVCVEVCSAAFYLDDDPGVLISACLFGDGAGAAVLSDEPSPTRRIEWKTTASAVEPGKRDLLRFESKNGLLRNILTPPVPDLAAEHARRVLHQTLKEMGVTQEEIRAWIWHAGGRDVLLALEKTLGLRKEDTAWSRDVLNEYGNMSSAFVYFVLQRALAHGAPGGWWWLAAFGAGFSSHGALLRVD